MKISAPLLIEWSPGDVRLVDPATGQESRGPTIEACGPPRGRDVVVAVGRRSAFVRSLPVPAASKAEISRVVQFGLMATLPLEPHEVTFGYRLGQGGRTAIVGAMRAESLGRVYAETQAAGLRIQTVLPVAFGAWLAAREHSRARCAVVEWDEGILDIDIVENGELVYSRSAPATDLEEVADEIARTFITANVPPSPAIALASPEIGAEVHDPQDALRRLANLNTIERQLFSLELPARREARLARAQRWRTQRALIVGGVALATSVYAYAIRARSSKPAGIPAGLASSVREAHRSRSAAESRLDAAERANRILDVAFGPAQGTADVVTALANGTPPGAWITSLSVVRGTPVTVAGYALHGKDVTQFFSVVAKNPRFEKTQVVSTSLANVGKAPVVQFLLSGQAVGTAPFDRPLRRTGKAAKAQSTIR